MRIRNQTRGEDLQDDGTWSTGTNFLNFDLTTQYQLHELPFSVDPGHSAGDDFRLIVRQLPGAQIGARLWIDDVAIRPE